MPPHIWLPIVTSPHTSPVVPDPNGGPVPAWVVVSLAGVLLVAVAMLVFLVVHLLRR